LQPNAITARINSRLLDAETKATLLPTVATAMAIVLKEVDKRHQPSPQETEELLAK